ncbi:hypothetical protein [Tunturibacter empetritectus]|uniref:Uncharacterized protein n=1 Tax=Tunturiibacter empetritectus TaxID=3069691 RepID=A0A7W8IGL0_9BACT|nr:hypothetical protein [Edaphobacter lichenicola]MBB5316787.1 hypothetical protein [Edaphobacter lichenicola]
MNPIKTILREIFGLFVDDGTFALAILLWLFVVRTLSPHLGNASAWSGPILFFGLALILIESAARYSRRRTLK